jgi:hypothetical protein
MTKESRRAGSVLPGGATFRAGMNMENGLRATNLGSAQTVGRVPPDCPFQAGQSAGIDGLRDGVQFNWHRLCCICENGLVCNTIT